MSAKRSDSEWIGAAEALGAEETQAICKAVQKRAAGDTDIEGVALPLALLSRASGQKRGIAVAYGIRYARMGQASERKRMRPATPESVTAVIDRAPVEVVAPQRTPYLEDVLGDCSPLARKILTALPAHLLQSEQGQAKALSGTVKVNGSTVTDALGWTPALAPASTRKGARQRRAALLLSCAAWSEVSEKFGNLAPGESKARRAQRAMLWVKRGYSSRQAKVTGSVFAPEVRVTRRVSVSMPFTPEMETAGPFSSPSYRGAAPVKRIRSPRATDGVATDVRWGMSNVGMEPREVGDNVKARRSQSGATLAVVKDGGAGEAMLAARALPNDALSRTVVAAEWSDWQRDYALGRVGVCPTADDAGLCQCPRTRTRGKALEFVPDPSVTEDDASKAFHRARLLGEPYKRPGALIHPLAVCELPTPDGRCGCGAKRGALVFVSGTYRHPHRRSGE